MLYNNFIVCIMTVAFFAMIDMVMNEQWGYIILPIGILIWGIFKFFDENDRKYLEGMGIDPDEFNAFFPDYYDNSTYRNKKHQNTKTYPTTNKNVIAWDSPSDVRRGDNDISTYDYFGRGSFIPRKKRENPTYKAIVKKCKRNFKISIEKDGTEKERVHHSIYNFSK